MPSIAKEIGRMTTGFDDYTQLLIQFPPRLISSDEEYWETQAVIDRLLDTPDLNQEQLDYLSLLGMLIERYDTENDTVPNLRGFRLIQALLNQTDISQGSLISVFQTEAILSNVLKGEIKPTTEQIEELSKLFQLPHGLFFEEETDSSSKQLVQFEMSYIELEKPLPIYTNGSSVSASVQEVA